jgi:acetyl-CoA C-acetyltransferase
VTAENVADSHGISRDAQDEFALESHRRAQAAMEAGRFDEEVVPIEVKARKGAVEFSVDEHVRRDASLETFAKLTPAFKKDGTVTAGNASGVNDAAAAQSLAVVQDLGLDPAKVNPNGGAIALGHPMPPLA